jgi:hypothetical protein
MLKKLFLALSAVMLLTTAALAQNVLPPLSMKAGEETTVTCPAGSRVVFTRINRLSGKVVCLLPNAPVATATQMVATATATPVPAATATAPLVVTLTPEATHDHSHSTPTPAATVDAAIAGQECPAWVHDQYVVSKGGHAFATWHPQADPSTRCFFAHEHGDDPRTSNVFWGEMPAFGFAQHYVEGHVHGTGEDAAHSGHKVFVANAGTINDENFAAIGSSMYVFHMGTSGEARRDVRDHSMEYRLDAGGTYTAWVHFMGDMGNAGTICDRDDRSKNIGRVLPIHPNFRGECNQSDHYEIWNGGRKLMLPGYESFWNFEFGGSFAAFNPATDFGGRDAEGKLIFLGATGNLGCDREVYHGGDNFNVHVDRPTYFEWKTDPFGNPTTDPHAITQRVFTSGYRIGIPRNTKGGDSFNVFKLRSNHCASGLRMPN